MRFLRIQYLFFSLIAVLLISSCHYKRIVDLIVFNGTIYTVNTMFSVTQAMAIKNGKIISLGRSDDILDDYQSENTIDLQGNFVYPGFIDAHSHFFGYATDLLKCDLTGTKSFDEIIDQLRTFSISNKFDWLLARGWDQNDWTIKEYPDKNIIDSLFPDKPVFMLRIDGHAVLCNQVALDMAGITPETKVEGGEILLADGKLTGLLIDNAIDLVKVKIPQYSAELVEEALLRAQQNCVAAGLTSVSDAGLGKDSIEVIQKLQNENKLKLRVYAMMSDDKPTLDHFIQTGPIISDRLTVRAIKVYTDGALGSRGACLKQAYSDQPGHFGFLLKDRNYLEQLCELAKNNKFQMCAHAIGDSAVSTILDVYSNYVSGENNRRWRIEHCQVVSPKDLRKFGDNSIIPSVQPTHATSDMYWAQERLGAERIKYAYAYNDLLQNSDGIIALGTDFPVESIQPLLTYYAAVQRRDLDGYPDEGFQKENELSKKDALRGMTIWAAYASFEDDFKGSLEEGKFADFVVLDKDILEIPEKKIPKVDVLFTFINGEKMFQSDKFK
ncbi:MAG TPA: amidohydrolase [Bacteroidia bacterium]|nr:amidohydrolase [Bacteroidia bacterium]